MQHKNFDPAAVKVEFGGVELKPLNCLESENERLKPQNFAGFLNPGRIAVIEAHLAKAVQKHPNFCENVTFRTLSQVRTELEFVRNENDLRENYGEECLDELIFEEILELAEANIEGNKELERQECFDAIALLLRRVAQIDLELFKKENR